MKLVFNATPAQVKSFRINLAHLSPQKMIDYPSHASVDGSLGVPRPDVAPDVVHPFVRLREMHDNFPTSDAQDVHARTSSVRPSVYGRVDARVHAAMKDLAHHGIAPR
mmetsp:Transcript_1749/g.4344  ORF Transcript_1749/g.4344 Transcript_1749/m.4344 type:complete len:108 (+) Transcript_1749:206-529(+)